MTDTVLICLHLEDPTFSCRGPTAEVFECCKFFHRVAGAVSEGVPAVGRGPGGALRPMGAGRREFRRRGRPLRRRAHPETGPRRERLRLRLLL